MASPVVLDESGSFGFDDHVHTKPALVKAALGAKLVQPRECGRGKERHGKHVKEGPDGNWGVHSKRGEKRRAELLLDYGVSVPTRVCTLYVGVVLIDGEVIGRHRSQ